MTAPPEIALIVATYNRSEPLQRFLETLHAQSLPREKWEVIVAVDGSTDQSMAVLREWAERGELPLRFFHQPNSGQAKARHEAILRTEAPRIVIIDDDMEVCADFLAEHLKFARPSTENFVVIGKIVSAPGWRKKPLFSAVGEDAMAAAHRRFERGTKPNANALATNVSFPRALYLATGGYDPSLRVDEDRDLGFRLERRGGQFIFSQEAWAIHHSDVGSFETWERRQYEYGRTACQIWENLGGDPLVHPLRNFLNGHKLKRWVVERCVPRDRHVTLACRLLRRGGALLQRLGLHEPALGTHKMLSALRYHQGARDHFGSWEQFKHEAMALSRRSDRPRETTSCGFTTR